MDTIAVAEGLRTHPFLKGIPEGSLQKLVELAVEVQFAKDQLIFREGHESSLFYLIIDGSIALEVAAPGRTIRISTLGAGDELGWSSLVTPVRKHFQARSLAKSRAFAFDGARLLALCDENCTFGYDLMRRVLGVLAERLLATRMQLIDINSAPGSRA